MIARLLRLASILAILALSACAGNTGSADLAPAPAPQPTAAAPAAQEPLTPEKAKADCWMKYEGDKKIKNIDQRLSLVEKCVDETLRGQLAQRRQR